MILDALHQLCEDQALTASAASTNVIPLDSVQQIGRGEPMAVFMTVTTAADTADGNETYSFAVQTDDNSGFSSATTLSTQSIDPSLLTVGARFVFPLGHTNEQYLRLYATLAGTTPSVTISAYLQPLNMIDSGSGSIYYPDGYTIA